jgi:hypothetical protein
MPAAAVRKIKARLFPVVKTEAILISATRSRDDPRKALGVVAATPHVPPPCNSPRRRSRYQAAGWDQSIHNGSAKQLTGVGAIAQST